MNENIGVIGTGRMGSKMAYNLLKAGHNVMVYDIDSSKCKPLVEAGAVQANHPHEVGEFANFVILSLLRVEIVEEVLFGEKGLARSDISGKIVIDTSTSIPHVSQQFAEQIAALGGAMLDSPVTGGEGGAAQGTLNMMVGGDGDVFKRSLPILNILGANIVHIGPSGHGQIAKAVNQMIMSGYLGAVAESFGFAQQLGADITNIFNAIESGGAQSEILSAFGQTYCKGTEPAGDGPKDTHYVPTFKKDVSYALAEGHKHDSYMPVTSAVYEVYKQVLNKGVGDAGPLRLYEFWRDVLNTSNNLPNS